MLAIIVSCFKQKTILDSDLITHEPTVFLIAKSNKKCQSSVLVEKVQSTEFVLSMYDIDYTVGYCLLTSTVCGKIEHFFTSNYAFLDTVCMISKY